MMADSELALRKALRAALLGHGPLTARLGGSRIHDEAPRNAPMPYVAFADARAKDWSTSSDQGSEHFIAIDVWSEHRGVAEALEIAALVATAVTAAAIAMTQYRLIAIAAQSLETRRQNGGRHARARQVFRAVVEKI